MKKTNNKKFGYVEPDGYGVIVKESDYQKRC